MYRMDANNMLEIPNLLQSDSLPRNEEPGDIFMLSSEFQESESDRLPSPGDEDSDDNDNSDEFGDGWGHWSDVIGPGLRVAHPEIEADVVPEDIGVNQTPALNQAQQAGIEQSQVFNLPLEIDKFGGMAGKPIQVNKPTTSGIYQGNIGQGEQPANLYALFASQVDWEFAKWVKLRGPTSTAVTDLLNIPGVSS